MITFRKLVMPADLNPANRLFGGQMLKWLDEAAALYAMEFLGKHLIVTAKISEINFKVPVCNGDFLEFEANQKRIGTKSITVEVKVWIKDIHNALNRKEALTCEFVFVTVDKNGNSVPHGYWDIHGAEEARLRQLEKTKSGAV